MRRGEIFRLQWKDIDFDRGFLNIRGPKSGKDQVIPLNAFARQVLESQKRTESKYVFPGPGSGHRVDIKRTVNRIKERAGIPKDFRPMHGCRHAFASKLFSLTKYMGAALDIGEQPEKPSGRAERWGQLSFMEQLERMGELDEQVSPGAQSDVEDRFGAYAAITRSTWLDSLFWQFPYLWQVFNHTRSGALHFAK